METSRRRPPSARPSACSDTPHPVSFGSIKAGYATLDRLFDGALKLALLDPAVSAADFPASEPDRRDLEVSLAELPIFHAIPRYGIKLILSDPYQSVGRVCSGIELSKRGISLPSHPILFCVRQWPADPPTLSIDTSVPSGRP
jgi:hypothetical protein